MKHRNVTLILALLAGGAISIACAQEQNPTEPAANTNQQQPPMLNNGEPLYRIQVVARDIPAINYFHRNGATHIAFKGTELMPDAHGTAKVDAHAGRTAVDLDVEGLTPANGFGAEYLTYVLWAITPEGRPVNLGEVLPSGSHGSVKMQVTSSLQSFGLIITAEPYYAVVMPSNLVVMQNVVEKRTSGVIETVNAHYTLLPRGAYAQTAGRHAVLHPITRNEKSPLEIYEAENAVQIAQAGGAEKYAPDTLKTAQTALDNAEAMDARHKDRKEEITFAREAVQSAEDARIITIRKIKEEDEAAERKARQDAEQAAKDAQAQQQKEAAQRAQAEAAAEEAKARAEAARADREKAEAEAAQAAAQAKAAQEQAQTAQQQAQAAQQREQQEREQLRNQLNQVLQTRETARGLIVNMSDVLFAFNKYNLKPEAREKLAKVSGILLAHPDLKIQVEGYTDNIGSDEYNQKLSEERAGAVRDYLVSQAVPQEDVTSQGFGKTNPVADNSTSSGRAQNRRVELVVSGQSIGIQQSQPGQSDENQQPPAPTQPATQPAPATTNPQGTSTPPQ
jgi:outer membrane protein OmpA-like peptidoglycan-associated protein